MTMQEVRQEVLALLGEDTAAYDARITQLVDVVQREIACLVRPIRKSCALTSDGTAAIPKDVYEIVCVLKDGVSVAYGQQDRDTLLLPAGEYELRYNAYPAPGVIELEESAQDALCYGIAALVAQDEPALYTTLNSKYNNLLYNLAARQNARAWFAG